MSHLLAGVTTKACNRCHTKQPVTEFYSNTNCVDGRLNQCRSCHKVASQARSPRYFQRRYKTPAGRAQRLFNGARQRARQKSLDFDLTLEWVRQVIDEGVCSVTGIPFDFDTKSFAPSLDRIDNDLGYTKENVRAVVWIFNRARGDGSDADVLRLVEALHGGV